MQVVLSSYGNSECVREFGPGNVLCMHMCAAVAMRTIGKSDLETERVIASMKGKGAIGFDEFQASSAVDVSTVGGQRCSRDVPEWALN